MTAKERAELLPSGTQPVFDNRVGWAPTYIKQAGLLKSPKRGLFQITKPGKELLAEQPGKIDLSRLDRYESFRAFKSRRRPKNKASGNEAAAISLPGGAADEGTPEDALATAYRKLRSELEYEVLEHIKAASPAFSNAW